MIKPHDEKFDSILKNIHLEIKENLFLTSFFNKLRTNHRTIKYTLKKYHSDDYNNKLNIFYKSFVNEIHFKKYEETYLYEYDTIKIYSSHESIIPIIILTRLNALMKTFGVKKKINIFLELNERKRIINNNLLKTTQSELNMKGEGLTTAGLSCEYIIITKKEEAVKLAMHEFCHYFNIQPENNNLNKKFREFIINSWSIEDTYYVYEAHCEMVGIIFHCMFLAIELCLINNYKYPDISVFFYRYLKKEIKYSHYLTCKILKLHGYNNCDDFFNKKKTAMFNSSIPAYIILRSIFFYYIDDYLDLLNNFYPNNDYYEKIFYLDFKKYTKDMNYIMKFVDTDNSIRYIAQDIKVSSYEKIY